VAEQQAGALEGLRVAEHPGLRRAVEVSRAWGVPPTVALGRAVVTEHRIDDYGRTVESASVHWTDEDLRLALELLDYEATLCPGCRHPLADTTAPEAEDRYLPDLPTRCHRCTALAQGQGMSKHEHPEALLWGVKDRLAVEGEDDREDRETDASALDAAEG